MVLKYHISPYPTLLEDMVVKIWEAQSDGPGAEVYTEIIPERDGAGISTPGAGHQVPFTVTANGLDTVVHIVRLFTNSGVLLHEYNAEPRIDIVHIFDPIRFVIGDGQPLTPEVGDNAYTNPLLEGLLETQYVIIRNTFGALHPVLHYTIDPDAGSFTLVDDDEFEDDEEWTILLQPQAVETVVNDSVVAKWFKGFVDVAASRDYINTDLRKLVRFSGSPVYTFPEDITIPIGYGFVFQHFGATGTAQVQFLNGQLLWNGVPKSIIDIPTFTEACFSFDGVNWNVVYMCQTIFSNESSILPGQTIAVGRLAIGDVASGNPLYNVIHNLDISGDYIVFLSIEAQDPSTGHKTNKLTYSYGHHATDKPNRFYVWMKEQSGEVQAVNLIWMIVKI